MRTILCLAMLLVFSVSSALAADVSERKFVSNGMSEGAVLMKIGKPDSESIDTNANATFTIKRWIYLPTPGEHDTITTVVLKQGVVIDVTRELWRR
jgi:hypothetical protein